MAFRGFCIWTLHIH